MNRILIFFLVFGVATLLALKPADETTINLEQAVKNGQVTCAVSVNGESTHYIQPLSVTVKNIKSTPVKVKVPNGFQFIPEDDAYQNIIITHEEMLVLNPGKQLTIPVYGMCTENHDRAPSSGVGYRMGSQANDKISTLTKYIERNKLHDPLGQSAVWAMTCGTPIEDITGFDTTAAKELVKYVANALGKPVPPPPAPNDTRRNYYATNYTTSMHGSFNYDFFDTSFVTIGMFNLDNIIVRELYRNPKEPPGKHKLEYKFDATQYTDDYYYFRLIADGEIILSSKIDNRNMFERN